jgi:hypothetical protein
VQIKHRVQRLASRTLLMSVVSASIVALMASPAAAADDGFEVYTDNRCGSVEYVDYGPGAPGGGNNDDYLLMHDYCSDGKGIKAWVWLPEHVGGAYGWKYSSNGLAGAPKFWDLPNITGGQSIEIMVCLSVGVGGVATSCNSRTVKSVDG